MAERRFHTPEPVDLEVKIPAGEIKVETVDGDESLVIVEGSERLVEQTQVELHGRNLVVEFRGKGVFGISISIGDFGFGNGRLSVRVQVPHGSGAALETASADMDVAGRLRSLETKSASGDLASEVPLGSEPGAAGDGPTLVVRGKTVSGDFRVTRAG